MKKILLLTFLIFSLTNFNISLGEKLPDPKEYDGHYIPFEKKLPIHYRYINDYANELYLKADGRAYGKLGSFAIVHVEVDKTGKILSIKRDAYPGFWAYELLFRKFLRDNPPPPFYEGMESEKIKIEISIYTLIDEQQNCNYMHDEKGLYKKACLTMHTADPDATLYGGEIFQYHNRDSWYADVHQKFNISLEKCVKTR